MKILSRFRLIVLALLFIGCAHNHGGPKNSSPSDLFPNFSFLPVPVSDLSIGAQWINEDIGAAGKGLARDKIKIQKSYSNASISSDRAIKIKLDAIILSGLGMGLDAGILSSTQVIYNNVEVVSVADVADMNIAANAKYIYKGIRIRSFTIYGNRETLATVDSSFSNASGTYSAEVTPLKDARNVSLGGGEGLFVAYQLVSFKRLEEQEFSTDLLEAQVDFKKYRLADRYEMEISTDEVWSCIVRAEEKREKPWSYDDWHWKNEAKDGERVAYLIHDDCAGLPYKLSVRNKNHFAQKKLPDTQVDLPFSIPWGSDTKNDPVIGTYVENGELVVDSLRVRYLRYENHEKTNKSTGEYSSGARLQGKVVIVRAKFAIALE